GDYYENGRLKYIVHYKEGIKEGDAFYYRITGELIFKEVYKNSTKHKVNYTDYFQYSPSGKLQSKGFLKENNFDSTFTDYYESGKLKSLSHFSNNLKNGPFEVYNDRGDTLQKGNYKNGNIDGVITTFYSSGNKKNEGFYIAGKLDGLLK